MKQRITETLKAFKGKADYLEIRMEESRGTSVSLRDRSIDVIKKSGSSGGCVRALRKGGWGFASFNDPDGLIAAAESACQQASLFSAETLIFPEVEPVCADVKADLIRDPEGVSLREKLDLIKSYEDVAYSVDGIVSVMSMVFDRKRCVTLATSEGTFLTQEFGDMAMAVTATAFRDGRSQVCAHSQGSSEDWGLLLGHEEKVLETARRAVEILDAPKVKGGTYPVILDQKLGGVFVHEAFGHTSEADNIVDNEKYREIMKIGREIGSPILNIYDTGLVKGSRGYIAYDDEGVPAGRTDLIQDGVLVGRLHSRETAARLGEKPTGSARAISYRHAPIPRMRVTCINEGKSTFDEMLSGIELGVYAVDAYGGCGGEMFSFTAGYGRMIRNGKLAELVRDVKLSGNLFITLKDIDMIGNDFKISEGPGGCGKGSQFPLPVGMGSPHIRIRNCTIGGE